MRRLIAVAVAIGLVAVVVACADRAGLAPPPPAAPASIEPRASDNNPMPPPGTPAAVSKSSVRSADTPAAAQDASVPVAPELPEAKPREGVCEPR